MRYIIVDGERFLCETDLLSVLAQLADRASAEGDQLQESTLMVIAQKLATYESENR